MINKKLNVGDYIFKANGTVARITKINKLTYTYVEITGYGYGIHGNIAFDGIRHNEWNNEEWFECEEPQAKALELAFKQWTDIKHYENDLVELKSLIGKAKYFLNQIEDIEEVIPD